MSARMDVLVVGAGLAGLECARRLGEAGASVLLADRKPAVDHAVHTTGIFVRRTLESFDLPDDCLGPPVRRVAVYSPRGRALVLESPHDEYRVGRMGPLYRRALDDCLRAGVQWAPATSLALLEPHGAGSAATLERGGRRERLLVRFVVGADGAVSRVAPALGLDQNREWIVGVEEVFRGVRTGHDPAFHCWIDPEVAPGYIAWVVDDGEEVHVGVGGYASRFRPAEALRRFHARVAPRFGLAGVAAGERRGGRIPVGGVLPRIACGRGLLTGDAAGAVSPLTAGGLDPCLRLSALAADVAAEFLATGDEAALAPYDGAALRGRFRTRCSSAADRSPTSRAGSGALRHPHRGPLTEWASRRVSGVSGVFSCRATCSGVLGRSGAAAVSLHGFSGERSGLPERPRERDERLDAVEGHPHFLGGMRIGWRSTERMEASRPHHLTRDPENHQPPPQSEELYRPQIHS